jgi:hypothetical protein
MVCGLEPSAACLHEPPFLLQLSAYPALARGSEYKTALTGSLTWESHLPSLSRITSATCFTLQSSLALPKWLLSCDLSHHCAWDPCFSCLVGCSPKSPITVKPFLVPSVWRVWERERGHSLGSQMD